MAVKIMELCRVCLKKLPICLSLSSQEGPMIIKMLNALTGEEIRPDSALLNICYKCYADTKLAYITQQKLLNSLKLRRSFEPPLKDEEIVEADNSMNITLEFDGLDHITMCKICGEDHDTYEELLKHSAEHFQGPQICIGCETVFSTMQAFRGHKNHRTVPFYQCETCKMTFRYNTLYQLHKQTHLLNIKFDRQLESAPEFDYIVCEFCGEKVSKRFYGRHMNRHRGIKEPFRCRFCKDKFSVMYHRDRHECLHFKLTSAEKKFKCTECDKILRTTTQLKVHMRQHTNERPYKCTICDEAFKQNVLLRRHMSSKHLIVQQATIPCHICNKKFATKVALNGHRGRAHFFKVKLFKDGEDLSPPEISD